MGRSSVVMQPNGLPLLAIASIFVISLCNFGTMQARSLPEQEEDETLELERRLNILNKPAVKSFETNYGTIDCIDIYKQPAFDNPLHKNHKLQVPHSILPFSFHLVETLPQRGKNIEMMCDAEKAEKKLPDSKWFGYLYRSSVISCPNGTVPIRRVTKDDLIREKLSVQLQDYDPFTSKDPNTYYAVVKLKRLDRPYVQAKATLGVFNPKADSGEATGAQIWVYSGGSTGNYISAGWMVHPDLYGDPLTHLTAFWKGDGGAGCANTKCPGFVQTYKDAPLGFVLPNISSYGGPLWGYTASIFQDQNTKNWWLATGNDLVPIGYWPKELFSQLGGGAGSVAFGGITRAVPTRVTPPMGSGVADCNLYHTAFVESVQYKIDMNEWKSPDWSQTEEHVDCSSVYKVQHGCGEKVPNFTFMYGGPGGVC